MENWYVIQVAPVMSIRLPKAVAFASLMTSSRNASFQNTKPERNIVDSGTMCRQSFSKGMYS